MAKRFNILQQSMRHCRSKLLIVIFFSFFINLLMFVAPLHMLQIYDRVLVSRSEVTLIVLTGLAIGLLVIYGLLEGVRSRILTRLGLKFDELMSSRVLGLVFDIAISRPSINQPQQIIRDTDLLRDFIGGPAIIALCDAPWVPIFIAVCFVLHPILGFIALSGAIIVFGLAASNEILTRSRLFEANKLWIKAGNDSIVSLRNSEIVKALGMLPGIRMAWSKQRDEALSYQSSANDRSGFIVACSRFARMSLQVIILAAGGYLAIQDQITPGTMIAASIIMGRALAPVEMAVSQWRTFIAVRDAYNRINEIIDDQSDIDEKMDLPVPKGDISLQSVYIVAPEKPVSDMIINNISLNFSPGTITGIVGPSGCGKSTLIRAIVGVWPVLRVAVRYDGANIQNWDSSKLGAHIGYMPQDVELFGGTVAQNISRFQEIDSDEIVLAAKKAGIHELILELPKGYDTNIGSGGQALSGGQRQRIALARALYKNPKIVILDEPNSNLDAAGEKALTEALMETRAAGATVVVVSHRPSLLASTDNIAVLNQGNLVKVGPRDEVLAELGGRRNNGQAPQPANN